MLYDLYLLTQFFPREQSIIYERYTKDKYADDQVMMAMANGFIRLSKKKCFTRSDSPFFYITEKGINYIEHLEM